MKARVLGFLVSSFIQLLALGVLALAPLAATDSLPAPATRPLVPVWLTPKPRPEPARTSHPASSGDRTGPPLKRPVLRLLAPAGIRSVIPTEPDAIYDLSAGWEIGPLSAIPGGPDVGWRETQEPVELSLVRVGGDIRPPKKVKHVSPIYPDAARYAHIEGDVKLQAVIDAEGNVTRVTITRSVPLLDRAAIEAVRQWKYEPTRLNGVAVPILLSVEVSFRLGPG